MAPPISNETSALYLMTSAVTLLVALEGRVAEPSLLITTGWVLGMTFAICRFVPGMFRSHS